MPKKIAIVGPESTGKTTIAKKLAQHYQCLWVPEYAREYLDIINRPYVYEDLSIIARGQLEEEDRKQEMERKLLLCDTNLVVIKIWSEFIYGKCDPKIIRELKRRKYDLYLLMNIDFPWMPDPQREHPHKRRELFDIYENELKNLGVEYRIIGGKSRERTRNAVEAIDNLVFDIRHYID